MLTRTLPSPSEPIDQKSTIHDIESKVDERGFYLYEWISPDELRMSVLGDYLSIIQKSSMPLAIVTLIAGLIGFGWGIPGALIAIFWVLVIFYAIVVFILIMKMFQKSYLYTRGANVVITDKHYVSNGKVVERSDFRAQKEAFSTLEKIFREPLLEPSGLAEHIESEKKNLFAQLRDIAMWGWKVVQNIGRSRDAWSIVVILMLAGVLYWGMMALVYFLWVFLVSLLARIFSQISHRALLLINNTEHEIQTLFSKIDSSSLKLGWARKETISLLDEAWRNDWKDNLSKKITNSLTLLSETASLATEDTTKLRALLESSKYKDIFNFVKYRNWTKKQILEPIGEILLLLEKNNDILKRVISEINSQIHNTSDVSLQKTLIFQKERLKIQMENFGTNIKLLQSYKEKLTSQ